MEMKFKFWIIFFGLYHYISGSESEAKDVEPYCFKFTWLGPMQDQSDKIKTKCSKLIHSPCFEPFVVTDTSTPPDLDYMWKDPIINKKVTCPLRSGYVCIKHTYTYNNAVINSTHFCGKMIEDKTTAISSGCFMQKVDGHTIETCACNSDGGRLPCNSVKMNQYSYMFFLLIFLMQIV